MNFHHKVFIYLYWIAFQNVKYNFPYRFLLYQAFQLRCTRLFLNYFHCTYLYCMHYNCYFYLIVDVYLILFPSTHANQNSQIIAKNIITIHWLVTIIGFTCFQGRSNKLPEVPYLLWRLFFFLFKHYIFSSIQISKGIVIHLSYCM